MQSEALGMYSLNHDDIRGYRAASALSKPAYLQHCGMQSDWIGTGQGSSGERPMALCP